MKITKRNGQEVEFNKTKIENAIRKANASVEASEQATDVEITLIAASIEAMFQSLERIPTVEEVQDTVEDMLMRFDRKKLAKNTLPIVLQENLQERQIRQMIRFYRCWIEVTRR